MPIGRERPPGRRHLTSPESAPSSSAAPSGIGLGIADNLAKHGARLFVANHKRENNDAGTASLATARSNIVGVDADVLGAADPHLTKSSAAVINIPAAQFSIPTLSPDERLPGEGWRRPADQGPGSGMGRRQHPAELDLASV
jgi:hypothetical protein